MALADAIAKAEVELVASVSADPGRLVDVAEEEGVTADSFSQEDLRLIFSAACVARHRPLVEVLRLARRALREEHYWNPAGPFGTGSQWSDETLVQLAESYPVSATAVRANARRLLALVSRWRRAEALLNEFRSVLTGAGALQPEPPGPPDPSTPRPAFVLMPRKRGAA